MNRFSFDTETETYQPPNSERLVSAHLEAPTPGASSRSLSLRVVLAAAEASQNSAHCRVIRVSIDSNATVSELAKVLLTTHSVSARSVLVDFKKKNLMAQRDATLGSVSVRDCSILAVCGAHTHRIDHSIFIDSKTKHGRCGSFSSTPHCLSSHSAC